MTVPEAVGRASLAGALGLALACAGRPVTTTPPSAPAPRELIVLLPDAETGKTGRAVVSRGGESVELDEAREATEIRPGEPPSPPHVIGQDEVRRLFGEALAGLPPPPRAFTLHFEFESDRLTAASREMLPLVLRSVRDYPAPAVTVIGHTDTAGTSATNFALGRQRAEVVRKLLVTIGIDGSSIEVVSHGETELLVTTPDDTLEPRNRRVQIIVR